MSIADGQRPFDRRWAGLTAAERMAERRSKLVTAGGTLLSTVGAAGVTVRAATRMAGTSSRYFYESFPDREALLHAVFDDIMLEILELTRAAIAQADGDFFSRSRAIVDGIVRAIDGEVPMAPELLRHSLADPTLRSYARTRMPDIIVDLGRRAMTPATSAEQPGEDEQAAFLLELAHEDRLRPAVTAIAGATIAMHLERVDGRLTMPRAEYVDHVATVVTGIVTAYLPSESAEN